MSDENKFKGYCQIIRGLPFPSEEKFPRKNIEDAMDYVPKDDDVVLASYPKTGSTWMQYIVLQIISKGESFPAFQDVTYNVVPFFEMAGIEAIDSLKDKPRIYKHHIPYNMVQKNDKAKCIYTYRNPEDTVVSFYSFIKNMSPDSPFTFSQFFEDFLTGNIGYGNYFPHVLSFYEHRKEDNLLLVSYEKLHTQRREEILRIARFLGKEHYECLLENEEIFNKVIEHTTFEYMKKNLQFFAAGKKVPSPDSKSADGSRVAFFRKGIVGDGKNVLTPDQQQRLQEAAEAILKGTTILNEWYPE